MKDQEAQVRLEKLSTRELMIYLEFTRKFNGSFSPWDGPDGYTFRQIKRVLDTREHIPNKAEAKRNRQNAARAKRHR